MNSGQSSSLSSQRPMAAGQPGVPAIYLLLLCDVVKGLGLDDQLVIAGLDVDRTRLLDAQRRVSLQTCHLAACRAVALAGDRGLGLAYARALNVTLHGSVGMMALSSPSIGAALDAASRFATLRAPFLEVSRAREGEMAVITVTARWDLGELERFVMESMLVGLAHMAQQLLGAPVSDGEIRLTGGTPSYAHAVIRDMPVALSYGHGQCQLRVPQVLMGVAPRLADPAVAALAQEQCELEFRQLFEEASQGMASRVRKMLEHCPEGEALPSLESMAAMLHTSSRTLKRRLQEEGENYRELMEACLRRRAQQLLEDRHYAVSEIAWRLGYNDVSNFSRAFRRWTGKTPRQWRGAGEGRK